MTITIIKYFNKHTFKVTNQSNTGCPKITLVSLSFHKIVLFPDAFRPTTTTTSWSQILGANPPHTPPYRKNDKIEK